MRAIVIGTHLERWKRADLRQSGSGPASESRRWSGFKDLQKWLGGLAIITAVIAPVQAQTVALGWAASPGPNLAGYKLCYGSTSGIYTNQTDVGNVINKTVSGLKNGVTYYFAVKAYNTSGSEAAFSNEIIYKVPSTNSPPIVAITSPLNGSSYTAPATINLAASVTANGHTVTKVQFYNGASLLGESAVAPYSFRWTNVPAGSFSLSARLLYDTSGTATSTSAGITVMGLPAPWQTADIGAVGVAGSTGCNISTGIFTVSGSGANIANTTDAFRFVQQTASGDCEIRAKVTAVQNTDGWAKAGVMIRETLNANSQFACISITANNGALFQYRTSTGGSAGAVQITGPTTPYWVRVVRKGKTFTGYISSDGIAWAQVGSAQTISMASNVSIGLCVTAHNNTALCTSTFSNVRAVSLPIVALTAPLNGVSYKAPATINLAASVTAKGHTVTKVQFYNGASLLGESAVAPYSFRWTNVPAGSFSLSARLLYDTSGTATSTSAGITVMGLPAPWQTADIGAVGVAGSAGCNISTGIFTVSGSGANIANTTDAFRFVQQTASGDCEIRAKVTAVQNTDGWAKAGVMIRETLNANSQFACISITANNGALFQYRTSTGGSAGAVQITGPTTPYWVRVVRKGKTFTGYISSDGIAWAQVGSAQTISMASNVSIGLCVTAHNNTVLCTSTFSNVRAVSLPIVALTAPLNGVSYKAPATINLAASVTAKGHTVTKVQFYNGASLLGESAVAPYSFRWTNVPAGSFSLSARLLYDTSGTATSTSAGITVMGLPAPWQTADIGAVGVAGSAGCNISTGIFTVSGSGANIANTTDAFRFVQQTASGDCEIRAKVTAVQNTDGWAKAGVMIRETLNANSQFACISITANNGALFQYRTSTGGSAGAVQITGPTTPYWVRVVRKGKTFAGYISSDGIAWAQVGSAQTISMASNVSIGLCVTAHNNTVLCTSTFSNVRAVSLPIVALTAPLNGVSYKAPATINLAASVTAKGHTVTKVQFYNGASLLGESAVAPYSFRWTNVPAGNFSLSARLLYDSGSTLSSIPASVTVTNPPPIVALTAPLNGSSYTAPATINLAASVTANGHTVTKVQFYNGASLLGESAVAPYSFRWTNVPAGSFNLSARLRYDTSGTATSTSAGITVMGLPAPWQTADIGAVGVAGSAGCNISTGIFTVSGSGANIANTTDAFRFVQQTASGDCEIRAKVTAVQNTDGWAKAGVMIRETLNANSQFACISITANNGALFQYRTSTGGSAGAVQIPGPTTPYWVRVVRTGTTFTGYISSDGITWAQVGSAQTISMASNISIGLCVTAHNNTVLCTSTFSNVTALP